MSDRDLNSRRPPVRRDRTIDIDIYLQFNSNTLFVSLHLGMPEWMDDNNDDDTHLNNATFEQDGTFTRSSTVRQNNDSEPPKSQSQSTSDESLSQSNTVSIDERIHFHV